MLFSIILPFLPFAAVADVAPAAGVGDFVQYGVLGVFTAILIWFAKGAYQREKDRSDKAEAEKERLYTLMLDRVIPALTSATKAAEDSADLLKALQRERELTNLVHPRRPPTASRGDDV